MQLIAISVMLHKPWTTLTRVLIEVQSAESGNESRI